MRAGPLSNAEVVSLLNRHYVPVFTSNEDYRGDGAAPPEERAAYLRIYRAALAARLSTGTVHAYVLTPDGRPVDSLHVVEAANVEKLRAMLERNVKQLGTPAGEPLVRPADQAAPPRAGPGELTLAVVTRYLTRQDGELVPLGEDAALGKTRNASWSALPSEGWVVLKQDEWSRLLPRGEARVGDEWDLDPAVTARVLTHFYPQTENNDLAKNRIEENVLTARVVSVKDGVVRARLDGRLRMKHPFYHKDDDHRVAATLVGFLDFEPGKGVRGLQLVTDAATYARQPFGASVRLVP